MPNPLNNVLLAGTAYDDARASILGIYGPHDEGGAGGSFIVANGPVFYQLIYGPNGGDIDLPERFSPPGAGTISPKATGIRFRNQSSSTPATVSAAISNPGEPFLSLSASTPVGATLITGIVNGTTGAPISGSGFSSVRNAAGDYTITFTTAFSASPLVLCTPRPIVAASSVSCDLQTVAVGSFRVVCGIATVGNVDCDIHFIAQLPV